MFITVNYELGYKFITRPPPPPPPDYDMCTTCASFYISSLFSLSLLSQLYEDYFSRHLFKLFSDS